MVEVVLNFGEVVVKPIVSVVIAHFNDALLCKRAVLSVCDQIEKSIEILLVDDHSSLVEFDSLVGLIQTLKCSAKILRLSKNFGPGCARNVGVRAATGKYVAFLDSDDFWQPEHLSTALRVLYSWEGRCIVSHNPLQQNDLIQDKARFSNKFPDTRQLYFFNFMLVQKNYSTITIVLPREILQGLCVFSEGRRHAEDFELFIRLFLLPMPWICIVSPRTAVVGKSLVGSGKGLSSHWLKMHFGTLASIRLGLSGTKYRRWIYPLLFVHWLKFVRRLFLHFIHKIRAEYSVMRKG